MTLTEKIDAEIKSAMLLKDTLKRDILRVIKAELARENTSKSFTDEMVIKTIRKTIKNLELVDAVADVYDKQARNEIMILEKYLPAQMNETELFNIVTQIILDIGYSGPKDMGKVIQNFNSKYPGATDGKTLAETIKKVLSNI
jgi:uncharacterized protein YqeY